jgi:hypothetical protein
MTMETITIQLVNVFFFLDPRSIRAHTLTYHTQAPA